MKLTELEHATLLTALGMTAGFYQQATKTAILERTGFETFNRHLKRTQELHSLLLNADYIEVVAL